MDELTLRLEYKKLEITNQVTQDKYDDYIKNLEDLFYKERQTIFAICENHGIDVDYHQYKDTSGGWYTFSK